MALTTRAGNGGPVMAARDICGNRRRCAPPSSMLSVGRAKLWQYGKVRNRRGRYLLGTAPFRSRLGFMDEVSGFGRNNRDSSDFVRGREVNRREGNDCPQRL